ncbi:MAG TPA: hypothetical protein VGS05_02090 [Candidatus Sulfotelmatobacter sp.]|nr:hypothetical protein [Candidatus Sulfotelmatobacter sp.]
MHGWIPVEALWWLALYAGCGLLVPWLLRWTQLGRSGFDTRPRKLFERGELGLFGLFLAISGVLDLHRSALPGAFIVANSVVLAVTGLMAGYAWLEDFSRYEQGLSSQDERTWVDSRRLLFLVFTVTFTTQVLLAHSAEALQR